MNAEQVKQSLAERIKREIENCNGGQNATACLLTDCLNRIEELELERKHYCEDWAEDDTAIKALCKPHLTEFELEGDSYGVPTMVDCAELTIKRLEERLVEAKQNLSLQQGIATDQAETIEGLRRQLAEANDWIAAHKEGQQAL